MLDPVLDDALARTSRSFALSLRALPGVTRRATALAYLFARAADTIADTRLVPAEARLTLLRELARLWVEGSHRARVLTDIRNALDGPVEDPAEVALLQGLPRAFELWDASPELERALTGRVLETIVSGMVLDLERFPEDGTLRALETRDELFDYCYRVAGCVGEFWTDLHRERLPRLAEPWGSRSAPVRARLFGRALQLTNVLRDVPRDLRHGRCYLPRAELAALGLRPEDLLDPRAIERARPLFRELVGEADRCAQVGWEHALAIPGADFQLRLATVLPLLLAHPTLALVRDRNPLDPAERRKVPRRVVLRTLTAAILALPSRASLRRLLRTTARRAGFTPRAR